jgi:hypothetical protein
MYSPNHGNSRISKPSMLSKVKSLENLNSPKFRKSKEQFLHPDGNYTSKPDWNSIHGNLPIMKHCNSGSITPIATHTERKMLLREDLDFSVKSGGTSDYLQRMMKIFQ